MNQSLLENAANAPSPEPYVMQKKMTDKELIETGLKVVSLLQKNEFKRIGTEFGYALSHDRPLDQAIEEDLKRELYKCAGTGEIDKEKIECKVSHFKPDSSHMKSLVECYCELSEENGILVELILTKSGNIYLEDISSYQNTSKE